MNALLEILVFIALYCCLIGRSQEKLPTIFEAGTVYLLAYSVLSSVLTLVSSYDHVLVGAALNLALALLVLLRGAPKLSSPPTPTLAGEGLLLLVVLSCFAAAANRLFEENDMVGDSAVYTSMAKCLKKSGADRYEFRIPGEPGGELRRELERRTRIIGIDARDDHHHQFYPGWPSILALGMELFGSQEFRFVLLVVGVLSMYWILRILRLWLTGWKLALGAFFVSSNPLLVYLARMPTSEMFQLLAILFALHSLLVEGQRGRLLSLLPLAALGVTHINLFVYFPVLLIYAAHIVVRRDRSALRHLTGVVVIFNLSQVAGYFFSPSYYSKVFALGNIMAPLRLPVAKRLPDVLAPASGALGFLVLPVLLATLALATCVIVYLRLRGNGAE